MFETIIYELSDDVATITLNRPKTMNGLSTTCRRELLEALKIAETQARVIVLTGKGKGFCSGQDLSDIGDLKTLDLEKLLKEEYEPLLHQIYSCKQPVIAAVNGTAAGAGANIALACDVVIATRSAMFLQAFSKIGLIPDAGGTYWLPKQIGFPRAMGAALFAEPISATQAADWGLIWEAVDDDQFLEHVQKRATQLAKGPTAAYSMIKQSMRSSFNNDVTQQLETEAKYQGIACKTDDFFEGVSAFIEKRAPKFKGR